MWEGGQQVRSGSWALSGLGTGSGRPYLLERGGWGSSCSRDAPSVATTAQPTAPSHLLPGRRSLSACSTVSFPVEPHAVSYRGHQDQAGHPHPALALPHDLCGQRTPQGGG